jgi:two-component system sensor kinase FixL
LNSRTYLPPIVIDPFQVQQVLINLVRNALEAMPADSPTREIVIRTESHAPGSAEIAVSDSGPGLLAQQCDRIFDAFFTTKAKGLGIGLSISRSIAETHGGRLWATPNPTGGVTFHLQLPVHRETA